MSFCENLVAVDPQNTQGQVGWIHNGPVVGWNWMNRTPYVVEAGQLQPVWSDGEHPEWPRIVSDALAAMLLLLMRIDELGGPRVPVELHGRRAAGPAVHMEGERSPGRLPSTRHCVSTQPLARRRSMPRPAPAPPMTAAERNRGLVLARCSVRPAWHCDKVRGELMVGGGAGWARTCGCGGVGSPVSVLESAARL